MPIILTLLAWFWGGLGDYQKQNDRITRLEAQRENDSERMERMDNKLDRILERVK